MIGPHTEGDQLMAAGGRKQGTLEALAVKNLTTGAIHHNPYKFAPLRRDSRPRLLYPLIFAWLDFCSHRLPVGSPGVGCGSRTRRYGERRPDGSAATAWPRQKAVSEPPISSAVNDVKR